MCLFSHFYRCLYSENYKTLNINYIFYLYHIPLTVLIITWFMISTSFKAFLNNYLIIIITVHDSNFIIYYDTFKVSTPSTSNEVCGTVGVSNPGYVISMTIRKYTTLLTRYGCWQGAVRFSEAILYNFDERKDVICCHWCPTCSRVYGWISTSFNWVCPTPSSVNFTAFTEVSYRRHNYCHCLVWCNLIVK